MAVIRASLWRPTHTTQNATFRPHHTTHTSPHHTPNKTATQHTSHTSHSTRLGKSGKGSKRRLQKFLEFAEIQEEEKSGYFLFPQNSRQCKTQKNIYLVM